MQIDLGERWAIKINTRKQATPWQVIDKTQVRPVKSGPRKGKLAGYGVVASCATLAELGAELERRGAFAGVKAGGADPLSVMWSACQLSRQVLAKLAEWEQRIDRRRLAIMASADEGTMAHSLRLSGTVEKRQTPDAAAPAPAGGSRELHPLRKRSEGGERPTAPAGAVLAAAGRVPAAPRPSEPASALPDSGAAPPTGTPRRGLQGRRVDPALFEGVVWSTEER